MHDIVMIPLQFYKQRILFEVEDAVTLDGGKTFLGVVQQFLDKALMNQNGHEFKADILTPQSYSMNQTFFQG